MKRSTTALLSVIAVPLAVLAVNATLTPAEAQPQQAVGGDPYIVKLLPATHITYHRVWSDGRVDTMQRSAPDCDYQIDFSHGPVEYPFPVVDAVQGSNHDVSALMLTFEDGRVDMVGGGERCTVAGVGTPSLCPADIDRDGEIGIEDFLMVLGAWGLCQ